MGKRAKWRPRNFRSVDSVTRESAGRLGGRGMHTAPHPPNDDRPARKAEPGAAAAALRSCTSLVACPEFGHDVKGDDVERRACGQLRLARVLHHLLVTSYS